MSSNLDALYSDFKTKMLTFNDDVARATGLIHDRLFLACGGMEWPCRIHSLAMTLVRVIISLTPDKASVLKEADAVEVNFSFLGMEENAVPSAFRVAYGLSPKNPLVKIGREKYLIKLVGAGRPPDTLIRFLGGFLQANANASKRKEARVPMSKRALELIGMRSERANLSLHGVKHPCFLLDLSFSGANILLNTQRSLVGETGTLIFLVLDPDEIIELPSRIVRSNPVEGTNVASNLGMQFDQGSVPMDLKMRLNRALASADSAADHAVGAAEMSKEKRVAQEIDRIAFVLEHEIDRDTPPDVAVLRRLVEDLRAL